MKRAVFYGRYSSDRQTEQSIEGQRRVCEEFAAGENIQIVREYIDRATSGTSTQHREGIAYTGQNSACFPVPVALCFATRTQKSTRTPLESFLRRFKPFTLKTIP